MTDFDFSDSKLSIVSCSGVSELVLRVDLFSELVCIAIYSSSELVITSDLRSNELLKAASCD